MIGPVTRRVRGIAAEVRLGPEEGLPRPSVANLDSLALVRKAQLEEFICALSPAKMAAIDDALRYALGLS